MSSYDLSARHARVVGGVVVGELHVGLVAHGPQLTGCLVSPVSSRSNRQIAQL